MPYAYLTPYALYVGAKIEVLPYALCLILSCLTPYALYCYCFQPRHGAANAGLEHVLLCLMPYALCLMPYALRHGAANAGL